MMDGTLKTIDGRPALRFERVLAYPVERVWRAVSDAAELERWFPAAVAWTPAPGEALEAYGMTGEITEVEPLRRLAWTFNGETYSFDLAADGESCRLTFTHVFDDWALAAQTAAGWETYFSRLEPHLDGGHLSEQDAHDGFEEIHEHYAERFGLDPSPGRQFAKELRANDEESLRPSPVESDRGQAEGSRSVARRGRTWSRQPGPMLSKAKRCWGLSRSNPEWSRNRRVPVPSATSRPPRTIDRRLAPHDHRATRPRWPIVATPRPDALRELRRWSLVFGVLGLWRPAVQVLRGRVQPTLAASATGASETL